MGVGLFLGAGIGSNVVEHTHPTKGDVLDGARSLLPPGYRVTSEALDVNKYAASWFATAAYGVQLEVEGGGNVEADKRSEFLRQAASEGWQERQEQSYSASHILLERPGVTASVRVGGEGGLSLINAGRNREPSVVPVLAFAAGGALVGLVIALVGGFLLLRRPAP